jgi:hypothetical protein
VLFRSLVPMFPTARGSRIVAADNCRDKAVQLQGHLGEGKRGHAQQPEGERAMINPISANGMPGNTPKPEADPVKTRAQVNAEQVPRRSEDAPAKLEIPQGDSVQLSPSAQARALRQAGQSIPQIAMKLGLAIPTVAAFFEE